MKCRKCKQYINERNLEKYIVHYEETHGYPISRLIDDFKKKGVEVNDKKIAEYWKEHKRTGQRGCEGKFGHKPTRTI